MRVIKLITPRRFPPKVNSHSEFVFISGKVNSPSEKLIPPDFSAGGENFWRLRRYFYLEIIKNIDI